MSISPFLLSFQPTSENDVNEDEIGNLPSYEERQNIVLAWLASEHDKNHCEEKRKDRRECRSDKENTPPVHLPE
jgi:hypothetical protein